MQLVNIIGKVGMACLMFMIFYTSILFLPNGTKIVDKINKKFFHRHQYITRAIMILSFIGIIYGVFDNM